MGQRLAERAQAPSRRVGIGAFLVEGEAVRGEVQDARRAALLLEGAFEGLASQPRLDSQAGGEVLALDTAARQGLEGAILL
jgi:hypothetical protein